MEENPDLCVFKQCPCIDSKNDFVQPMMPARNGESIALNHSTDRVFRPEPKEFFVGHFPNAVGLTRINAVLSSFDRTSNFPGVQFSDPWVELLQSRHTGISRRSKWPAFRVTLRDSVPDPIGKLGCLFRAKRLGDPIQTLDPVVHKNGLCIASANEEYGIN